MRTIKDLQYMQAMPLDVKVGLTKNRLREWVNHYGIDGVYVSFSGGKDSTVLLDIARKMYGRAVLAVFHGTPLPKGHGRIADIDKVLEEMKATRTYDIPFALERVKPIIEADRSDT